MTVRHNFGQIPLDGLELPVDRATRGPIADLIVLDDPPPDGWVILPLPRWDTAFEVKTGRGGWPKINQKTRKVVTHRPIWDPLQANSRAHWTKRHHAVKEVIDAVTVVATRSGLQPCRHMDVVLVWAPGHNRGADEDNRWPLLKACCDALARGPRRDLPGLRLVADDDSRHMSKSCRIDPPPAPSALYLEVRSTY